MAGRLQSVYGDQKQPGRNCLERVGGTTEDKTGSCPGTVSYTHLAGAIATGGVISLLKSLPLIIKTFAGAMKSLKNTSGGTNVRTDRDLKMPVVLGIILIVIILIWLVPSVPVSLLGAFLIAIFGFFFATVSSRMVGLIGSSNNPVSGMALSLIHI